MQKRITSETNEYIIDDLRFPPFPQSRILIHIAFHFVEQRLKYLFSVINTINTYEFSHIKVIIDTNNNELNKIREDSFWQSEYANLRIEIRVHNKLEDPFFLTWAHRENIIFEKNNYDYFLYTEDDLKIEPDTLIRWRADSELLNEAGYLRGFLRTELKKNNGIMFTDQKKHMTLKNLITYKNKSYFYPSNPYQGFWLYSKHQMTSFLASSCWKNGNYPNWGIRERAASGMIWRNPNHHNVLIPLTENLTIPDDVLVHHLPNNYANDPELEFGNIPRNKLTRSNLVMKIFSALSKLRKNTNPNSTYDDSIS